MNELLDWNAETDTREATTTKIIFETFWGFEPIENCNFNNFIRHTLVCVIFFLSILFFVSLVVEKQTQIDLFSFLSIFLFFL